MALLLSGLVNRPMFWTENESDSRFAIDFF